MAQLGTHSSDELIRYIEAAGESANIDAKGPMQWDGGDPAPEFKPGQWLEFKLNMSILIEFFMFLSRFAENLDAGEELVYEVTAGPLTGRRLATIDHNINLDPSEPCRATTFRRQNIVTAESLRASWEEFCVKTLAEFFELFQSHRIPNETWAKWVERFKERLF